MTTHLSTRLAWHDRGWDGCVCDAPHLNSSCIVHGHIRDERDDNLERANAGVPLGDLDGWLPPCSRDTGVWAPRSFPLLHEDPLDRSWLQSTVEEIPPYSCCPSAYRWMREDFFRDICEAENLIIRGPDNAKKTHGWVAEPDRQKKLLESFWGQLTASKSLVFYYCAAGNPVDEEAKRLLLGVGRVASIGPQLYFGTTEPSRGQYPIWSRHVTQAWPAEGVRLPYHAYLQADRSTADIACRVPGNAKLPFSYVAEHVSDDIAVAVLERMVQSVERVKADGVAAGDWTAALTWLNDVLAETWTERGPYPGIGSVLQHLGCAQGTTFQRVALRGHVKAGDDLWTYVRSFLEGRQQPPMGIYHEGLCAARDRWKGLPPSRHSLLDTLVRFELTPAQVERVANPDSRRRAGITASVEDIIENPYVISEQDQGWKDSHAIALETVDHGMRPEWTGSCDGEPGPIAQDDRRRVRAVAYDVLSSAANAGDTLLTFTDLMERIRKRFPERRECRPDSELVVHDEEFYNQMLWTSFNGDPMVVSIRRLFDLERSTTSLLQRRARRQVSGADASPDWTKALCGEFGEPTQEREEAAFQEKAVALQIMYSRKLSILTGGAGTGKTSLLKVFLDQLDAIEGRQPILLLAPTGKARVRLSTKTSRNAMTIHQFLLRRGWLNDNFNLRESSDQDGYQATTVVIDECSMIPTDLLGTALKALDSNSLRRLVLVGDPFQLPPIGPGRPFVDTIEWLRKEYGDCLAALKVCMRTQEGGGESNSTGLSFANGYRSDDHGPDDDEILARIAKGGHFGDLDVAFWNDHDQLRHILQEKLAEHLDIEPEDFRSFNQSFGIDEKDWTRSEAWQILSPTRSQHFGTEDLNRHIQFSYRRGLLKRAQNGRRGSVRPFGDQQIVWNDKVIQVVNAGQKSWPPGSGLDYVANGEIGVVSGTGTGNYGDRADVSFSTQPEASYRYSRRKVEERLELAYALTVHKAQGSDFDVVILVIPQSATTLSRELLYTGLTRFRSRLVLLIEKDIQPLMRLRRPDSSDTGLRNTHMFTQSLRPDGVKRPYLEALIHRTPNGTAVRSKSEVIVATVLDTLGMSYNYEEPLYSPSDPRDFRLPDFTVSFDGDVFYWEHLGMLSVPSYREGWERKKLWYERNGFADQLITSQDDPAGGIDAAEIERIARERILEEEF